MALPPLQEPGEAAEGDQAARKRSDPTTAAAWARTILEDRPDDEGQAEDALEQPAEAQ